MVKLILRAILISLCCIATAAPNVGAQTMSVFEIDASSFPAMKAKLIVADKAEKSIRNFTIPNDIVITENGKPVTDISVMCPPVQDKTCVNVVIVIDQSLSMYNTIPPNNTTTRLEGAQEGAITFLQTLDFRPPTVVGLTTFDKFAYTITDFRSNSMQLINDVQKIEPINDPGFVGTNYYAALVDPFNGAIPRLETLSKQCPRIVVFLTDGSPIPDFYKDQADSIIKVLKTDEIQVYAISIGSNYMDPQLKRVALESGGSIFVKESPTVEELKAIYKQIAEQIQGAEPCTLTWTSSQGCGEASKLRNMDVTYTPLDLHAKTAYTAPDNSVAQLRQSVFVVAFGNPLVGQSVPKTLKLKAVNSPFSITGATFDPPNPYFTVLNWGGSEPPFTLGIDEEREITVQFTQQVDQDYRSAKLLFSSSPCVAEPITLWGGAPPAEKSPLRLYAPNGDRNISACDTTTITWGGIPDYMPVNISYSTNEGGTWTSIKDKVIGQSYPWKPSDVADKCLIKVESLEDYVDWKWIRREGDLGIDRATGVGVDAKGISYVVGEYSGTIKIDTFEVKNNGSFLAKYLQDGSVEWARRINSGSLNIVVNPAGESVVMGKKFLMKYNTDGTDAWGNPVSYPAFPRDTLIDLALDGSGNYVVGGTTTTPTGGPIDEYAMFIDKYGAGGTLVIPRIVRANAQLISVAADITGNIAVAGFFSGKDGDKFGNTSLNRGYFLAKFDNNGTQLWVRNTDEIHSLAMAFDLDGNIYQTGWFNSTRSFGSITVISSGNEDVFLAKYSSSGTPQWVNTGGVSASSLDYGVDVTTDINNNCYLTGIYSKVPTESGSFRLKGKTMPTLGKTDVFIAKFSSDGQLTWLSGAGGDKIDSVAAIAVDRSGRSFLVGLFEGSPSFGLNKLNSRGQTDAFIACIGVIPAGSDLSDQVFAIQAPKITIQQNPITMGAISKGNPKVVNFNQIICNTGSQPLTIRAARFGGANASDFQLVSSLDGVVIEPGECKPIEIAFTPSAVGARSTDLIIESECVPVLNVPVTGEGLVPCNLRYQNVLDIGETDMDVPKTGTFTSAICNDGSEPITITISLFGPGRSLYTLLSATTKVLAPGECYELQVQFTPTGAGSPEMAYVRYTSECGSLEAELKARAVPVPPVIEAASVNAGELDCPGMQLDTILLVTNLGKTDLLISNVALADGTQGFSIISWPQKIAPKTTDTIFIRFIPTSVGFKSDVVVVTSNASNEPSYQIPINGKLKDVRISLDAPVNFGVVAPGAFPVQKTMTITNTGDVTLTITAASFGSGAPFTVVGGVPLILKAKDKGDITIEFTDPGKNGQYTFPLTFATDPSCSTYVGQVAGERKAAGAVLSVPDMKADPHDRNFRIPVQLASSEDFALARGRKFQITVQYNDHLFLLRKVSNGSIVRIDTLQDEDRIIVGIEGVTPDDGSLLTELVGDVLLGDTVETPIVVEIIDWEDVMGSVEKNGSLRLTNFTGASGVELLLHDRGREPGVQAVVPNPSSVEAKAIVQTVEIGEHALEVYDASGRMVYRTTWIETATALQQSTREVAIPSGGLAVGAYRLLLKTPSRTAEGAMVIIR